MTHITRFNPAEFNKAFLGFDQIFDQFERSFANSAATNYPPYNISKLDDNLYAIDVAVTGFDKNEITVQVEGDELLIAGSRDSGEVEPEYIHRGLALRNFERKLRLAEHMQVNSAEIKNGILSIKVERVIPEEMKPKLITVTEIK